MIGNDIVDLAKAKKDSNCKRAGFLDKLFTKKEQELIVSDVNPELIVWNLWSRKEAAYKIYNRITGIRAFIPLQLSCDFFDEINGIVKCNEFIFYTKTTLTGDQIHTVAVIEMDLFAKIKSLRAADQIIKIGGLPYYYNSLTNENIPASISHHGRYQASITL
jgi:phosphopantetheinyl transferase (holo-ACP synthase)